MQQYKTNIGHISINSVMRISLMAIRDCSASPQLYPQHPVLLSTWSLRLNVS